MKTLSIAFLLIFTSGVSVAAMAPAPSVARLAWSAPIPHHPYSQTSVDCCGRATVSAIGNTVLVSDGDGLDARDLDTGRLLWQHPEVDFFVTDHDSIFASAGTDIEWLSSTGSLARKTQACVQNERAGDILVAADRVAVLCIVPDGGKGRLVVLDKDSGAVAFTSLEIKERPEDLLQIAGPDVVVDASFSGAWDGENEYYFDLHSGRLVAELQGQDLLAVVGNRALLNDDNFPDKVEGYEPAMLSWLDLSSGSVSREVTLAPQESNVYQNGHPLYNGGPTFVSGDWLYLKLGPILYRYALPAFDHREIVLRNAGPLFFAGAGKAAITIGAKSPYMLEEFSFSDVVHSRPIVAINSPSDEPASFDQSLIPWGGLNGESYLIDLSRGEAYLSSGDGGGGWIATTLTENHHACVVADLSTAGHFNEPVLLRVYDLQ